MTLVGKRVLITRAEEDTAELAAALEQRGAQVLGLPTIVRAAPDDPAAVVRASHRLGAFDGIGVGALSALRPLVASMVASFNGVIGCVGQRTADGLAGDAELRKWFTGPVVVPATYRAEALVEALVAFFEGDLSGRRFCVPRAPEGRRVLADGLRAAGGLVEEVVTYQIRPAPAPAPKQWAEAQQAEVALFASGQTLDYLLRIVPEAEARAFLARATVGVIGPIARERADALGIRVDVVPARATMGDLIEAVEGYLSSSALNPTPVRDEGLPDMIDEHALDV